MAANLAINQLTAKTPASTDIVPVADPSTGIAGKSLVSDIVNYGLPSQTGNSGKFLTTNGTISSWASVLGSVNYQGTWDASTNTPSLASGVGTKGFYYVVSADGSTNLDGVTTWKVGDWAIFNGTAWQKVDNTDAVISVNGYTGTVSLNYSDVGSPSTSGTNATGTWAIDITGNSANVTGTVAIANGGTGTSNGSITGTGALTFAAGGTNQNVTISPSGTGKILIDGLTAGTAGTSKTDNTVFGYQALAAGGDYANTAIGCQALNATTTGWESTAVGYQALKAQTTGGDNTAIGYASMLTCTNGIGNTAVGVGSLYNLTTGSNNIAIGFRAAEYDSVGTTKLTDPENSIYIGYEVKGNDNSDTNSIVIGYRAIGKGANTTVLGNSSTTQTWLGGGELRLPGSTSGYIGLKGAAAAGSTTYTLPSADGTSGQVLSTNGTGTLAWSTIATSGGTVTSVGGTGTVNGITLTGTVTSSGSLTLGGSLSGVSLTTQVSGTLPVGNGGTGQTTASAAFNALSPLTTLGDVLYASGANTAARLAGNTTSTKQFLSQTGTGTVSAAPSWSTVSKSDVGLSNVENTALSTWAGTSNITTLGTVATGTWNATTIGISKGGTGQTTANAALNALLPSQASQSGKYLKSDGTNSSWATVTASPAGSSGEVQYNSSGSFAGAPKLRIEASGWPNIIDPNNNIKIGPGSIPSTCYGTIAIGDTPGTFQTSGQGNTCIGAGAGNYLDNLSTPATSNVGCVFIGELSSASSSSVWNEVNLGNVNTATLRCAATTITSLSDARDKTNITPMPSVLSFIASLNPVRFDWWTRNGAKIGIPDYGFIAQELQQAQNSTGFDWAQLVYESNPDRLEATPGKLIPILVKAIQELAAKVAALEAAV